MLKDCIVTAVELVENYQPEGQDTKLTRNFIPEHYFTGIKSLLNLDKELLIYCNKSVEEDITNALKDKVQSLPTFINKTSKDINPFYDEIFEYSKKIIDKNPTGVYCWSPMLTTAKLFYILDAISLKYERVVWMDAGLSNESYIPEECGGTWHDIKVQNWDNYYPKNENDIFNPTLGKNIFKLFEKTNNFMIGLPYVGIEPELFIEKFWDRKIDYWSASAGLLGLTVRKAHSIKQMYIGALKYYLSEYDRIFTEIELFTFLNVYFNFAKLTFANFNPTKERGSIYDLLKNKINYDEIRFSNINL